MKRPTHELGSLRPRCVECPRYVEKQFDRCAICQAGHEFTGPITRPLRGGK